MIAPATQELPQPMHDPSAIFKAGMLDPKNTETGNDGKPSSMATSESHSPQRTERNAQPYMQISSKTSGQRSTCRPGERMATSALTSN